MANISRESEYYKFGYQYFGPFLLGYTRWLIGKIQDEKLDKVFFFSRDGYMMEKAYDIINGNKVDKCYVYFSRKSIRQALLCGCDTYEDSLKYLSIEKYISLGKILEYYGFSEQERQDLATANGWDLSKDYEFSKLKGNEYIFTIFESLKDTIIKKSKSQSILLKTYINQIGMSARCGIIDIGWHGSMQYYLESFFEMHKINVKLTGFYVGIIPKKELKSDVYGFLYDEINSDLRKSVLCFFGGYEKLFQSLEGSTYGYKYMDGLVIPVLNTYEYEKQNTIKSSIIEWQQGAIDFIKSNKNIEQDNKKMAMALVRVGRNPTLREVSLFKFFYNTDGVKEFYVSQKPLYQYRPKEFVHLFNNSVWKTGFMKSVFKIPFPYYWIYRVMKK